MAKFAGECIGGPYDRKNLAAETARVRIACRPTNPSFEFEHGYAETFVEMLAGEYYWQPNGVWMWHDSEPSSASASDQKTDQN